MFGLNVTITNSIRRVEQATEKAAFKNLRHAAARISKDAKASIDKDSEPSAPGDPPHTRGRGGHNLKGAIRFDATKDDAVIGPIASYVGEAGHAHEFGVEFRGTMYPERPFMEPALANNVDRFARDWAGSIGG